MRRKHQIGIPVNKKEKQLIQANAKINNYKSVAGFLRDKGLETDISNKAILAIMLAYLSSHMKDLSNDSALDWTKRKNDITHSHRIELAGMDKMQREKYLTKLENVLDHFKKGQSELEELLKERYVEE